MLVRKRVQRPHVFPVDPGVGIHHLCLRHVCFCDGGGQSDSNHENCNSASDSHALSSRIHG